MKNRVSCSAAFGLWAMAAASAQVHPGYTFQNVTFSGGFTGGTTRPLVGGMDVFPDGRVAVVEWGVPAGVYILSGLGAGSANIQVRQFAKGLDNAMGLKIVDNVIYVMEKEGLTQLLDIDGDGVADQYNCINQAFPSNSSMLNFPYDVGYANGAFVVALSSDVHQGGYDWGSSKWPGTPALAGRSTAYRLNLDGTSQIIACGFRNPNGMGTNGNDIFVSDNQGSWLSSSKVINIRQGRFYGHQTVPANPLQTSNNNVESPPVIWNNWDNNETGRSSGNPIVLQHGKFAGHILVPDLVVGRQNPVFRVFVENVKGELQGCILPFVKSGTSTGVHRVKEASDGSLYLGLLGSNGGWDQRPGMTPGFNVLRPNSAAVFEVLAVRSLGAQNFELEFTKPVGANANQTGTYTVTTWQQVPVETYGGGNNTNNHGLTVNSATVSADRLKVNLQITGLQQKWEIKFVFNGLAAQDGNALFTNFAVYNLNQFGPGADYLPVPPTSVAARAPVSGWNIAAGAGFHRLRFFGDESSPKMVAVYDMQGAQALPRVVFSGSEMRLETGALSPGLYFVRVAGRNRADTQPLVIP